MKERRRYKRFASIMEARYHRFLTAVGADHRGVVVENISEGGVCFKTCEFIPMADRIVLYMYVPPLKDPIKVITKVAWMRHADGDEEYEIGNQFLEMKRRDKKLLSRYLESAELLEFPD